MGFNVVCSMLLVLLGSPLRIYIISNGGYLLSCSLAFAGYFVYRQLRPDTPRPFRLPTIAKWFALAVFVIWMAIYFFGGWNSPKIILADPHQGPGLYLLGLLIVALYAPLYWWRAWQDRRLARAAAGAPAQPQAAAAPPPTAGGQPSLDGETSVASTTEAGPSGDPPAAG
jgi:amino acid transporter